ncbi:curli assembly protein CsgF [uncultured Sulfitobacter sp.]|uniref:curli assembly protein CsgF n=1 Tax=uncultured Sulfitobacter sp. TaxID=191468 RepID=UPI0030D9B29D|tara:strand:- start:490 stop:801 length:312 start_codon:yes stop_codon:yes gene_type:complete
MKFRSSLILQSGFAAVFIFSQTASAGELLFNPVNPGFGGNPNNIDYLLNLAQLQNQHLPPASDGGGSSVPQINFPPITIDLGGVVGGTSATTMQVDNGPLTQP